MTPPEKDLIGITASREIPPADLLCALPTILTQRRDFQRASRGKRVAMAGFILQAVHRPLGEGVRVGYTCSKKVGNAVARNRAKRRLREIARTVLPMRGKQGHDYVLVGRNSATTNIPFHQLLTDMEKALDILHGARK